MSGGNVAVSGRSSESWLLRPLRRLRYSRTRPRLCENAVNQFGRALSMRRAYDGMRDEAIH